MDTRTEHAQKRRVCHSPGLLGALRCRHNIRSVKTPQRAVQRVFQQQAHTAHHRCSIQAFRTGSFPPPPVVHRVTENARCLLTGSWEQVVVAHGRRALDGACTCIMGRSGEVDTGRRTVSPRRENSTPRLLFAHYLRTYHTRHG